MGLTNEIERLTELHRRGSLSDEEFARAKAAVLSAPPEAVAPSSSAASGSVREERGTGREREERQWAMYVHFSLLAGLLVPLAGYIVPIVLWQTKKAEMPSLDAHGHVVVNWMISSVIYWVVSIALALLFIGIPLLIALGILGIVFPILGGLKANEGVVWRYPGSIPFLG